MSACAATGRLAGEREKKDVTMPSEHQTTDDMPTHEGEYDFTLVLDGISDVTDEIEDAIYEAGCSDATLSVRHRRVFLTFSRSAPGLREAIAGAVRDVESASIGAVVLRVDECGLVSQADIARRIGRSRQLVGQYISGVRGDGAFPPPACNLTNGYPLWYWCEVACWLCENNILQEEVLQQANDVAVVNAVLELRHHGQLDAEVLAGLMGGIECRGASPTD